MLSPVNGPETEADGTTIVNEPLEATLDAPAESCHVPAAKVTVTGPSAVKLPLR